MAKPRSMKRDVDKAKKERAAMKRERRQRPAADKVEGDETSPAQPARPVVPPEEVIARLGELHVRFEAEEIDFVEYEQVKGELVALLTTD